MSEAEILEEIQIFRTAIKNIALTGQRYEIGSGASKRVFEAADLQAMKLYLTDLNNELAIARGNAGIQIGY